MRISWEETTQMMKILVFKEKLKKIYSTHSVYIIPTLKFLAVLIAMLVINANIGFMSILKSPIASIFVAAVCSFIPAGVTVLILSMVILLQLYSLAVEITAVALILMLIMFILYYRFTAKDSYVLILVPVLFFLKIPYLIPLVVGIVLTPVSIVSVSFGTILYYIMHYTKEKAALIANTSNDAGLTQIENLLSDIIKNKEMILMIAVFALVIILVYVVRRLSIDHAHVIAIVSGGLAELVTIICATFVMDIEGDPVWMIAILAILCTGIVYVLNIFILSVDYNRTEYTQFEDDDYYYYVKAVPKIKVTAPEVKVKHINVQRIKQR